MNRRLQLIVQLAATRVPYYRERWRDIEWRTVRSAADLHHLPLLDKQAIRQNEREFIAEGINPKALWMEKTSGTTGTALRIYWSMSMLSHFWAVMEVMVRHVAGVAQSMPRAMMGGRPIVRGQALKPPYWRFNRRWRQLYLSSYHVSARNAPHYAAALHKYRSEWMTGYGSAIAALAESALTAGIDPIGMRAVIVSGDTLLPGMRRSIEEFFRCKCFDHYGQSEGVAMAMECPSGRMHVIPELGIVEILRDDGSPCRPGETGEIVATGLMNDAMPLLRYRLGDYAAWADDQACPCGNRRPAILRVEGRVDDYLVTEDGRKVGRLAAFRRSPSVHSAQIVQDRPGRAWLLVRPGNGYSSRDALAIREDILERVGKFDIEVYEVPEIPKTPQGKNKLVVSLENKPSMRTAYRDLLQFEASRIGSEHSASSQLP
jgi:phenylacetate-CoA ligase